MKTIPETRSNPAAESLLSTLKEYLRPSTMAITDVSVPGEMTPLAADLLLVGEFETVAIIVTDRPHRLPTDWKPAVPLGLVTHVYSIPATGLFYHLDDFAFMVAAANPSLFKSGASVRLKRFISDVVEGLDDRFGDDLYSVVYPSRDRINLDVEYSLIVHSGSSVQKQLEKAA